MSKQSKKERREARAQQVVPPADPTLTPEAQNQPSNSSLPVQPENTTTSVPEAQLEPKNELPKKAGFNPETQEIVEKKKLDGILEVIEEQKKQIEILRDAVNQGRLGLAEDKRKKSGQKKVFLKVMEDKGERKLIVGWKSSPDCKLVYSPTTGNPIGEILQAKYFFHDGTESEYIDQVIVTRISDLAYATVESETPDAFVLRFDDSHWGTDTLTVHKQFVNP